MPSRQRFADKAVIVTGCASGIGRASATAFASEGGRVACLDYDVEGGTRTAELIREAGGEARYFELDVTQVESVRQATDAAVEYLGGLDVVHNNAGANGYAPIHEMSVEAWDHIFAVNTRGVFLSMKFQIPHLLERGGAIVLTGSVIQHASRPTAAAYAASKLALEGLAKSATLDYGQRGIRVNIVAPGTIDTPMVRKTLGVVDDEEGWDRAREKWIHDHLPGMRRMGVPEDIAGAVLMLASDDAGFVSGATLFVDGGMSSALP